MNNLTGKNGENGDKIFLQELLKDFISEFKDVKKEVRDSTKAKNDLIKFVETRPCFKGTAEEAIVELADHYLEQKDKCKSCSVTILEKQIEFKNKIISFMIYTLAVMATATAMAAGWLQFAK